MERPIKALLWSTQVRPLSTLGVVLILLGQSACVPQKNKSSSAAASSAAKTEEIKSDSTAPTASSFSASSNVSATGMTLNWLAGSDNLTVAEKLEYFLCYGPSAASIDSVEKCEAETQVKPYTTNGRSHVITGKVPSTTYYYNVVVKDEAGNKSIYSGISQPTSADTTAPVAGAFTESTNISDSVGLTRFTLNWSAASDDATVQTSLQYFVCSGASAADIDTLAECAAATQVMNWSTNTTTLAITGKSNGQTFFYNVIVKDSAGNKAVYETKTQPTVGWQQHPGFIVTSGHPSGIAISSDGYKMAIAINEGYIQTSIDAGTTWTQRSGAGTSNTQWTSIASSSDGSFIAATDGGTGYIWTSTDSGATWTQQNGSGARLWKSITCSVDCRKMAAGVGSGTAAYIYTSSDYGVTWTERTGASSDKWTSIDSSSDGTQLAAVGNLNSTIWTSSDSGATWTQRTIAGGHNWVAITSSADGSKLAVASTDGNLFTSTNFGASWTERIRNWNYGSSSTHYNAISSSADGLKIAVVAGDYAPVGQDPNDYTDFVYTSIDGGATWSYNGENWNHWIGVAYSSDGNMLAAVNLNDAIDSSYLDDTQTYQTPPNGTPPPPPTSSLQISANGSGGFGTIRLSPTASSSVTYTVYHVVGTDPSVTGFSVSGLAAPFAFAGGSFPGTGGTCASTITAQTCTIVLTYTPTTNGTSTLTPQLNYTNEQGAQSYAFTLSGKAFTPDASSNVLILYNTNSSESVELLSYLQAHRPGYADANVLALNSATTEIVTPDQYTSQIKTPVADWIAAHPSKNIQYVILLHGLPTRVRAVGSPSDSDSVQYKLSLHVSIARDGIWAPKAYIFHLAMGSLAATKKYIDKLESISNAMVHSSLILSATDANLGGSNYEFDDAQGYSGYPKGDQARTAVLAVNPSASVNYQTASHISSASDVLGYQSWGYNGGMGGNYPLDGQVRFSGKSSWYLIETFESYNGQADGQGFQAHTSLWFQQTSFGGTNYENTPVGAVPHTEEPGVNGVNKANYFSLWEAGNIFAEAAWESRVTNHFMAVGDPLVVK